MMKLDLIVNPTKSATCDDWFGSCPTTVRQHNGHFPPIRSIRCLHAMLR